MIAIAQGRTARVVYYVILFQKLSSTVTLPDLV